MGKQYKNFLTEYISHALYKQNSIQRNQKQQLMLSSRYFFYLKTYIKYLMLSSAKAVKTSNKHTKQIWQNYNHGHKNKSTMDAQTISK